MLGTDADDERPAAIGESRSALGGEREFLRAQLDGRVRDGSVIEIHRRRAHERGNEEVARPIVELLGRGELLQPAVAKHGHAIAHRHRLGLVVGDVERRHAEPALDAKHLAAHLHAQLCVEIGQRLVHQEDGRLTDERPSHRHALTLPAGELARTAVQHFGEPENRGGLAHPTVALGLCDAAHREREPDVVVGRQMRIQRVVLKDHGDVTVARRQIVDDLVVRVGSFRP